MKKDTIREAKGGYYMTIKQVYNDFYGALWGVYYSNGKLYRFYCSKFDAIKAIKALNN